MKIRLITFFLCISYFIVGMQINHVAPHDVLLNAMMKNIGPISIAHTLCGTIEYTGMFKDHDLLRCTIDPLKNVKVEYLLFIHDEQVQKKANAQYEKMQMPGVTDQPFKVLEAMKQKLKQQK